MRIIIGFDGASENSCLRTRYTTCMYFNPAKDPFFFFFLLVFTIFVSSSSTMYSITRGYDEQEYNVRRIETTF